jgi:hypothetical protein
MKLKIVILAALLCAPSFAQRILRVGADQQYKTLALLPKPLAGDIVEIGCGVYPGVKLWKAANPPSGPIQIRGACPVKPAIEGGGSQARGIFEFDGGNWVVEDLEFRYISNGNLNSAGVRNISANVTLRRVKISNCDMGVMGSDPSGDTIIEDSGIGFNGRGALGHNLYLHGQRAIVRRSHIHHSIQGQNVKIRNRLAELTGNYIHDGNDGEVEFVDSPLTLAPGADAVMDGNQIVGKAVRTGGANLLRFINFGHTNIAGTDRAGTLILRNNTFIARNGANVFVTLASKSAALISENNSYIGSKSLLRDRYGSMGISSRNDRHEAAGSLVPARFAVAPAVLPAPTDIAAVNEPKAVVVTWAAVPGASHYVIYSERTTSAGKLTGFRLWGASTDTSFRDLTALYPGKPQSYQIVAVNAEDAESPRSAPVQIVRP